MNTRISQTSLIYGMHEPCPPSVMPKGWILFLAEVGHGLDPHPGIDFTQWASLGYGVICRVHHQFGEGGGCLPLPQDLGGFLQRVASLTRNSQGCDRWIIGNECNLSVEWPNGEPLTPEYVAQVYNDCRDIIDGEVVLSPVGPWNVEIGYGWMEYFTRMIQACETIDAFALHTYSRGSDPSSIWSEDKMDPPYEHLYNGFRTYRDWLAAIPEQYRHLPTYITEANQNQPWLDENNGWVKAAYKEINDWNKSGQQQVHCLCLYRWPKFDQYHIDGKGRVQDDFREAQAFEYHINEPVEPPIEPEPPVGGEMEVIDSFEDGFYRWNNEGEVTVPNKWHPDWVDSHDQKRPEYKPDTTDAHVYDGDTSAKMTHRHTKFDGILYRTFSGVKVDARVDISVYFKAYSDPKGGLAGRIGIDSTGGTDFRAPSVQWGDWWGQYQDDWSNETWHQLTATALAQSGSVTVFLEGRQDHAVNVTAAHWDLFELTAEGDAPIPPDPDEPFDWDKLARAVEAGAAAFAKVCRGE